MNKLLWIKTLGVGVVVAWGLGLSALGEEQAAGAGDKGEAATVTVITSEKLVFDHLKQFAEFEENVVVTDPSMNLTADYMKVWFDDNNEVKIIEAKGHVYMRQQDTEAWAGRAEYLVQDGKIVLREKPKMTRGKDLLTGDVITFFRDENKMIVSPRARLVIFPEKGQSNFSLTGDK